MSVNVARKYVVKWAPVLGFGHYRLDVREVPKDVGVNVEDNNPEGCWGRCVWSHEKEFAIFEFTPDGVMTEKETEFVVLHELTHGLVGFAQTENEETVCNRIPRILMKTWVDPTHRIVSKRENGCWDNDMLGMSDQVKDFVGVFVDSLDPEERRVVEARYWQRLSFAEIGREMNMSKRTVGRIMLRAQGKLAPLISELSDFFVEEAE